MYKITIYSSPPKEKTYRIIPKRSSLRHFFSPKEISMPKSGNIEREGLVLVISGKILDNINNILADTLIIENGTLKGESILLSARRVIIIGSTISCQDITIVAENALLWATNITASSENIDLVTKNMLFILNGNFNTPICNSGRKICEDFSNQAITINSINELFKDYITIKSIKLE